MPIPAPPPPPYHAVGTEPFWNLLIDEHNLTFTLAGGQPVLQPTPFWRNRFLATSMFNLHGSGDRDNALIERARTALAKA